MKIIFMGTHEFAVKILERILIKHEVILVVTQPDSLVGRKKILTPSKVKECALLHNLEVFQPVKLNQEKEYLFKYDADLIVTAAYGQIISQRILDFPKYGCINVHGSLLPSYRGGAPIQRSIINGDHETGITIMYMSKQMDAGDIIAQRKINIEYTDTQATLFDKLSILGSDMILNVIASIENKTNKRVQQDESKVTYAFNLTKEDEIIDFNNKTALQIYNQIRGLNPNPGATFYIGDLNFKVFSSEVSSKKTTKEPGVIQNITKSSFDVSCKDNTLITFYELLPVGKKLMKVRDYLNGSGRNIIVNNRRV